MQGDLLYIDRLEAALQEIGNLVGGPTMTYAPRVEVNEWRDRAKRISKIVSGVIEDGW